MFWCLKRMQSMKRYRYVCLVISVLGLVCTCTDRCLAEQSANAQDDALALQELTITSSADGSEQPAMFWTPTDAEEAVPLLVDLHTWSGDYKQTDPRDDFLHAAQQRGWAFIHPNFRGPNVRPQACASDLAVADVLDAVEYAKRHGLIDEDRIYLVGASGGGHMALVMACRSPETWAGVSAWVPITDLAAWYEQNCKEGKPGKYAKHLEQVCGGAPGTSEAVDEQYRKRSSLFFLQNAKGLPIDINAGIHDGHTGSVPISQSLLAFNVLAEANGFEDQVISDEVIHDLLSERVPPEDVYQPTAEEVDRKFPVLFRRQAGPVRVTIFDGGHRHDTNPAVEWLAKQSR